MSFTIAFIYNGTGHLAETRSIKEKLCALRVCRREDERPNGTYARVTMYTWNGQHIDSAFWKHCSTAGEIRLEVQRRRPMSRLLWEIVYLN